MYLQDNQLIQYRDKLDRISAPHQCILQRSGIFEINLLTDYDSQKILRNLQTTDFVSIVNRYQTNKYDFGHFEFKSGKPEPEKFFTVRGIIKEPTNEDYDLEEAYGDREKWIDIIRSYGKEYNFNKYTDAQLYSIAYRLQEYEPKKKPEKRQQLDLFDGDKYNKKPEENILQQEIHRQELNRLEKDFNNDKAKSNKYCSKCGHELNDAGECPSCDLGDESVWDESLENETSVISNNLLEDIEKHDSLNPKLWNEDNTLKPEVKEKIMEIVKDFTDGLAEDEIKFNLLDVKLVGSNCSYNYNKDSDLDVHLVADTDSLKCPDNLYPLLYSAYRSIWNNNHDVSFYGIPVEIFVETSDTQQISNQEQTEVTENLQEALEETEINVSVNDVESFERIAKENNCSLERIGSNTEDIPNTIIYKISGDSKIINKLKINWQPEFYTHESLQEAQQKTAVKSNGVYSVMNDKWIKEPVAEDIPEIDRDEFNSLFQEWEDKYFELKTNPTIDKIDNYIDSIYELRKKSIADEGEYGFGNLIFKEARARGYLDDLKNLKIELQNKKLSLESLKNS